jgi:hypothetical protein
VSHSASTLELLAWLAARSRTYGETLEAWRTSCPRLSVWEDALADGLVEVRRDRSGDSLVGLTGAGRAALADGARGAVAAR